MTPGHTACLLADVAPLVPGLAPRPQPPFGLDPWGVGPGVVASGGGALSPPVRGSSTLVVAGKPEGGRPATGRRTTDDRRPLDDRPQLRGGPSCPMGE